MTTCTSNATFYEPAAQAHLTSNATYKRYVAAKVSASSNTTGTVTIQLYDVTTSAQLATTTITIASINTETVGASTTIIQQVTNLGDVLTIRVKHSVNGATVTLNSGGMMEGDQLREVTATGLTYITPIPKGKGYYCYK